ncbi:MAG: 2-hydroxyacyl-CoA dehydratase, partial [Firmicutes bacterium]|nr:2-hydroxyacyl-CoA dehydratase [Bacillota bacterium]
SAGLHPLFAEGLSGYLNGAGSERPFINAAENYGVPKTFCSYHKTMLGAAVSGMLPAPKCIVHTTIICDANNLTFRTLEEYWGIPRFVIDVPTDPSEECIEYVAGQFRELRRFTEDISGKKITDEQLAEIMRREKRSMDNLKRYYELLPEKFISNTMTSEMYKVFLTHILFGTEDAEKYFELLREDIEAAEPSEDEIRIIWGMVLPNWQKSIREILNNSKKYQILCTNMNFDVFFEPNENDPFRSMAERLVFNALNSTVDSRAENLLEMAKRLRADGAVYFNHWGCKQTMGGSVLTKTIMEEGNIPTLILDGDGCDRSNVNDGQMVTRLQAFIEMLEASKK